MREKVSVNTEQCKKVGKVLAITHIRDTFYKRDYLTLEVDIETKLWMYFISVGICHQTHTLHSKKLNLFGWDYLEHVFIGLAQTGSSLLDPEYINNASAHKLTSDLKPLFSDDLSGNCTLDRLDERVALMKDMAKKAAELFRGKLWNSLFRSETKLVDANLGLYQKLLQFEAYSDPLFKKSTLLIKFLVEAGIIEVLDPENFIPIMDYHMQRVLLRTGCVEVNDDQLKNDLKARKPLNTDSEVREACINSIRLLCDISGHPITIMNDFFWPLGRSCCNETLLCREHKCEKTPCSFWLMTDLKDHTDCIFSQVCLAASDDEYKKYWQPVVKTHFY